MTQKHSEFYNLVGNNDGQTLNLSINDDIGDFFAGTTSDDFARVLNNKDISQINIDINTKGGSVHEGISIFNQLRNHPATVTTNVIGQAASIGTVIFAAGDERTMDTGATLFFHPVRMNMGGAFLADELRELADEIPKLESGLIDIIHSSSSSTREEIAGIMGKETRLTDKEALDMGLATEISSALATNLKEYSKTQAVNYKEDKEKIQQVLNNTSKILNNKPDRENVMEKKEFDNKLADLKSEFTNKMKTLETNLEQANQSVNTYKEQVITLESTIVEMNNKAIRSEFSNFVDGLVSQGKVLPAEKDVEITNLELRKNDAKMLDSYKELLNSKPAKFTLRANVASNGPDNALNSEALTEEEKAAKKKIYSDAVNKSKRKVN